MRQHITRLSAYLWRSKPASIAIKFALSIGLFWLVLGSIDFGSMKFLFNIQDRTLLVDVVLLILAQVVLGGVRWHMIMATLSDSGRKVMSLWEAVKLYYISLFFNACMPGTVGGDAMRVWMAKSERLPMSLSVNSVVIDRAIALLGLGLLVILTLPVLGKLMGFNLFFVLLWCLLAGAVGIWFLRHIESLLIPYQHVWGVKWMLELVACVKLLLGKPLTAAIAMGCSLAAHILFCLSVYVLAQSLSISLGMLHAVALVPAVMLAITLPISIGGWGVREAGMVGMLALVGVSSTQAMLLSVELGVIMILFSLPGGLLWLLHRRRVSALPEPSAAPLS